MKISPVNEDEYKMRNLWPKGVYACTVKEAEEGASQRTGDKFFKAEVHVFNDNGGYRVVTTYIMAEGKAAFQLREAAEAFGLLDKYKAGEIEAHDLSGQSAYARLGVEDERQSDDGTRTYPAKNVIRGFKTEAAKTDAAKTAGAVPAVDQPIDDDIPF